MLRYEFCYQNRIQLKLSLINLFSNKCCCCEFWDNPHTDIYTLGADESKTSIFALLLLDRICVDRAGNLDFTIKLKFKWYGSLALKTGSVESPNGFDTNVCNLIRFDEVKNSRS